MRHAGIKLAGNSNQTVVAIQNTAMQLSRHTDGGGARDGGGTEAFSGSDNGGQSRPNIAMTVWQGRLQAAMVGQLFQHSDGSGASDVPVRQHGSLEGVGSVHTREVCHPKSDILVIIETQFFWKSIDALF